MAADNKKCALNNEIKNLSLTQKPDIRNLTDDEIIKLLDSKKLAVHALEDVLGAHDSRAVEIRRKWLARKIKSEPVGNESSLNKIPFSDYDYSQIKNACCENVIGYVRIPLGYAGPLKVDGRNYFIPMATTEGCLIASTNRGCRAVSMGEGVSTVVRNDSMTRAPVLEFDDVVQAAEFVKWTEKMDSFRIIKQHFDATSKFVKLKSVKCWLVGRKVYIRFAATTGDAMGMNMVSKATEAVLDYLRKNYFHKMSIISLSGNACSDKKAAAVNWIEGRGKSVVAEAVISAKVVETVLKTSVQRLIELNVSKNLVGSAVAGALGGFNAHSSNIVAAVFLATGQDAAQVVSGSNCLTEVEETDDGDLRIFCTMPSIEIGTVGGGTGLSDQSACLAMLGVDGPNRTEPGANAKQFARTLCAAVLAGEISLLSALCSGDLVKSHIKHNRSRINLQEAAKEAELSTSSVTEATNSKDDASCSSSSFHDTVSVFPESCSKVLI